MEKDTGGVCIKWKRNFPFTYEHRVIETFRWCRNVFFSVCLSSSSLFAMMTLVCTKEKKTFQTKFFFRISSTKIFLIIIFLLQQVSCYIQHQQLLRNKVKKLHFHTENTRNRSDERFNNPKNKMTIVIHSFNDDD